MHELYSHVHITLQIIVHKTKLIINNSLLLNYNMWITIFQVHILHLLLVLDFQDRVLRQLSHIKLHLFKLDEKLSALNYPSLQNTNIIDFYDTNILDNFPLQYEQDLQNVEIKLKNDDIYKSNMVRFEFLNW